MFLAFFAGAVMYGAVTLVYLIVASTRVRAGRPGNPFQLMGDLVAAVFWPATLVVLSLSAMRPNRTHSRRLA
ncbi:hypothetical protein WNZ15_04925 [Roseibium sp. AS2]|uniref:hypothetical protein n=1 Tax=Roseibium sp. AS2 TaxID=3135781 RepID=UPI003170CA08